MLHKTYYLIGFILVALAQLYIPLNMIWEKETILKSGIEYKFRTAPIDPNDPFRGKYITLDFEDNKVNIANASDWEYGDAVYVQLDIDQDGFARPTVPSKTAPRNGENYLLCSAYYANYENQLIIDYPFNRLYMEEHKAKPAEKIYAETQRDTSTTTYALVRIKDGQAVLQDVFINDTSIRVLAGQRK